MIYNVFSEFIADIPDFKVPECEKVCPVCGCEQLHIFRAEILVGDVGIIVKGKHDIKIEAVEESFSRGVEINLYYSCENAEDTWHGFIQKERFRKGSVICRTVPIYVGKHNWFRDIWRD